MAHGDITHIDIPVSDLGAAGAFYRDLFGWQISAPPGFEGYPLWHAPNGVSGGGLAPRAREGLPVVAGRPPLLRLPARVAEI